MKFCNFDTPILGHHYFILSLSHLCYRVEKTISKLSHCMTYMAMNQHKKPCEVGHEIYNFGRPFLGHYYYTLSLSELRPGIEKKIFLKKYINFTLFTTKLPPLWVGGHEIYNFLSPYPTNASYQIC